MKLKDSFHIQENLTDYDFQIGDIVKLRGIVSDKNLDDIEDIIIDKMVDRVSTNCNQYGITSTYSYYGQLYRLKKINWWISPYNIIEKNNSKRILNLEDDPFGEEDWGYMKENFNFDHYEIGDKVVLRGEVSGQNVNGVIGEILYVSDVNYITTNYNEDGICPYYKYEGKVYLMLLEKLGLKWSIPPYNIEAKIKNKKRILNLEDDPFGEEDWGYMSEEYRYFKFRNDEENIKDPKEPFFNFRKTKYFELKEYLNKNFAPYLTYRKYLKYKEELENVGIVFEQSSEARFRILSYDFKTWRINSSIQIYFISDVNRIIVEDRLDRVMFPRNEDDEFDVEKAIDYLKKRYGANRKNYDKYKVIDPFGEEDWSKTSEQFDWWDDDPFWRRYYSRRLFEGW